MGYYTETRLVVYSSSYTYAQKVEDEMRSEDPVLDEVLDAQVKLYNAEGWENRLKKFSKKYPKVWFRVEGVGEEIGDHWFLFVQDGKSYVHYLQSPEFQPERLK